MNLVVLAPPARKRKPFPLSMQGLQWAYEADRLVGADLSAIASWPDLSGKERHISQGTGASQPTLRTNILNGLPVARFDGGDSLSASGWTLAQSFTLFVVALTTAVDAVHRNLVNQASGATALLRKNTGNRLNLAAATNLSEVEAISSGVWFMAAAIANGVSSTVAFNGSAAVSGDAGANGMTGLTLGSAWTGDIYAAYGWSAALTNAQLNQVAAYFAAKTTISSWVNL